MSEANLRRSRVGNVVSLRGTTPEEWIDLRRALAESVQGMEEGVAQARRDRARLEAETARLRSQLDGSVVAPGFPPGVPDELRKAITTTIRKVRRGQRDLLARVDQVAEELEHAKENEDRFVVLVFGEVKSGKTALANHLSGSEFDLPPGVVPPSFFVGDGSAERLEERPTEATKEYQGFRAPGILWIDCPGVLSETSANQELALRLVGRADFILLASSSDAPFKSSEMRILAEMIERSGNTRLDGRVLVTKSDTFEETWDDARDRLLRRLRRKPNDDIRAQQEWCVQQLRDSGLIHRMRDPRPQAVSVYLGRDALGRDWESGLPHGTRGPRPDWREAWRSSGLAELCETLARVVRTEGSQLKAAWPDKRRRALDGKVSAECERATKALEAVQATVAGYRSRLAVAGEEAAKDAAEKAAAGVRAILVKHGAMRACRFDAAGANTALRKHLKRVVTDEVDRHARPVVEESGRRIGEAVDEFLHQLDFEMNVETRTGKQRFRSRTRGGAVGRALGVAGGAWAGARLGAAACSAFGPIGSLIGGILGGIVGALFGSSVGEAIGSSVGEEEYEVQVETGTNGDEVIAATAQKMGRAARKAVRLAIRRLDSTVYATLAEELDRIVAQVRGWQTTLVVKQLPRCQTRCDSRVGQILEEEVLR